MINDYIIKETLGKGSYGIVYKVQKKNTNEIYVIKQISLNGLSNKEINEVNQEAKILNLINSDFVVKYYDSFKEKDKINIVMEYCDGGDLNDFLKEKTKIGKLLEEDLIWTIFIKITIGLADIHKRKILHRDLKTLNVFLKKDLGIKIGDLGVAKILLKNSFAKTVIGTPYYLSPEICEEIPYNDKSDVWALGCILYELCTFKHPFEANSQGALILKILNNKPEPIDKSYSDDLSNLIYLLLEKNCKKRPSCEEILKNNIEKIKKLGLYDYIIKRNNSEKNHDIKSYNKNVKIYEKIIDSNCVNINAKYYSKNNSKENIHKNIINSNKKNPNNKKHVSAINLLENIKNKDLKFNNINQQINPKKKNSDIKINVITIGDNKDKRPLSSAINSININHNKKPIFKYNNFFISNNNKKLNKKFVKSDNNEKVIISKKISNINKNNQDNQNINGKKNIIHPVKIIFKNPNELSNNLNNNYIENNKNHIIFNDKSKNGINLKEIKRIKDNNIKKNIPKYKFNQKDNKYIMPIKIKQIPEKDIKLNNEKEYNDKNKNTTDKNENNQNLVKNNNNNENQKNQQINNKKKYNIIISNNSQDSNKKNLLGLLKKDNKSNRSNINNNKKISKIKITDDNNKNIDNTNNNNDTNKDNDDDKIIFNDKKLFTNFEIEYETSYKNNENNYKDNIVITNESEDSINENKDDKDNKEKFLKSNINNENEIYISDIDKDNYEENEDENVKEIKENNNKENLEYNNKIQLDKANKEISEFNEKILKIKNEMKQLIGENKYKYIMNLYNNKIKEDNKIDEIYTNIEDYANKNFPNDIKENFNDCYLRLIILENQLEQKKKELNLN